MIKRFRDRFLSTQKIDQCLSLKIKSNHQGKTCTCLTIILNATGTCAFKKTDNLLLCWLTYFVSFKIYLFIEVVNL